MKNEKPDYTFVHFELDNAVSSEILSSIRPLEIDPTKGVVLSGRGPIWLYCYLVHHYHPTKFVAVYDPRIGGAVVVESHTNEHKVGEVIRLEMDS